MKKILSILLASVIMLTSVACFNVSAFEIDKNRKVTFNDLYDLYYGLSEYWRSVGYVRPFENTSISKMHNLIDKAEKILYNEIDATDSEVQTIYYDLWDQANNMAIAVDYAYLSYEKACKEQNYNDFYSEEDWNSFVQKRENLKTTIDKYYGIYRYENGFIKVTYIGPENLRETAEIAVSDAFYAMLKQYNEMTNKYTVIGDVDKDGDVTVKDATLIQKYLVETEHLTGAQIMLAGASNYDYENLTIMQATEIQKKIAECEGVKFGDKIFIPKDGCFESYERRIERTFNYIICPRRHNSFTVIGNGYYDTWYLEPQMEYYNRVVAKKQ